MSGFKQLGIDLAKGEDFTAIYLPYIGFIALRREVIIFRGGEITREKFKYLGQLSRRLARRQELILKKRWGVFLPLVRKLGIEKQ